MTRRLHSPKPLHNDYGRLMSMERIHWICTPFLLATLCTITGYVTGYPTTPFNSTDIITELQSTFSNVSESSITQASPQYSTSLSEVPSLPANQTGANQTTENKTSLSTTLGINSPLEFTTTLSTTTTKPPTTATEPLPTTSTPSASTPSATTATRTTVTTTLPATTTTSHPSTKASTSTTLHTTTVVKTFTTLSTTPIHGATLQATTPTGSTPQGAPTSTTTKMRESTHIPENQPTESGDWNIIGISGNSFTGKILLPIAVGTAFSVIIIAVAYCYCSRRGSHRVAKSSRNGVHRMTSNDRVMLLADSSEDEF